MILWLYRKVNDGNFGWRALRLLARRSPHFFVHGNYPINKLPEYLETMIKKIAKDRPVSIRCSLFFRVFWIWTHFFYHWSYLVASAIWHKIGNRGDAAVGIQRSGIQRGCSQAGKRASWFRERRHENQKVEQSHTGNGGEIIGESEERLEEVGDEIRLHQRWGIHVFSYFAADKRRIVHRDEIQA